VFSWFMLSRSWDFGVFWVFKDYCDGAFWEFLVRHMLLKWFLAVVVISERRTSNMEGRRFNNDRGGNRGGGRDGRGGGRDGRGGNRGGFSNPTQKHKAICTACKKECEVPFKPTEGRDVFCQDCFKKQRDR
jgi:CxxC-x17-CxxC domain-containing protein